MTNKEERPAGCVLRLFGAPEQTVQKAVEALPDTWQGTVHCRSRGAETLVALQSSTPQQLHRAVQQLRTRLAPALYGEGEQTLAAAAVQALEQHRKLLVCSDTAAGALLETRLENLPGAEKVFDFGAMSYANTALTARLSRKLRKAPQAEPARTLARVQVMQKLTGAALAVGCVELPQSRLLLVGSKKGCWLRCVSPDENPGLWLLDMLRRAACGLPQAGGTNWQPYGRAVPDAALTPSRRNSLHRRARSAAGWARHWWCFCCWHWQHWLRAGIIPAATLPPCPKSCKALAQKACPTPGQSWCERCVGAFTFNREKTKPGGFVNLPGLVFALASPM